jgi:hypothetical protein
MISGKPKKGEKMSSLANASAGIIQAELGNLYDTQPFI